MNEKGNKFIVYENGEVEDEFGNQYTIDKQFNLFDSDGQKHILSEQDAIGFNYYCEKRKERIPIQSFSFAFEVNVSAELTRGTFHDDHIIPMEHQNNTEKTVYADFIEYIKSEYGHSTVLSNKNEECPPDDSYKLIPRFEVKLKSKKLDLQPIREKEQKLDLQPLIERELDINHPFPEGHQNVANFEDMFSKLASQYEINLEGELRRILVHLYYEVLVARINNEARDMFIANMVSAKEKSTRRRIPIPKGRIPIKQRNDFDELKKEFLEECQKILKELELKKARLNKSQLAKKMFRGDNPLLLLNRKLKDFDFSFEQIMDKYMNKNAPGDF